MKFPIEMYKIRLEDMKIKVPCEWCLKKGIIDKGCNKCGGNGVHSKTIKAWKVAPRTVTVYDINRSSKNNYYHGIQTSYEGGLRYWIGVSEFFNEEDRYLHFSKDDAQKECDKRNVDVADVLKINDKNKHNKNNKDNILDVETTLEKLLSGKMVELNISELSELMFNFPGKINTLMIQKTFDGYCVVVDDISVKRG